MSRFLFAWELGVGFGHVGEMLPVARLLRDRGHEVCFAVRSLDVAAPTLGAEGFAYVAAPVWTGVQAREPAPAENFSDMLMYCGYGAPEGLIGLIKAWREIFRADEPDIVIADHAPTALLAARVHGVRRAAMGIGFYFPPSPTSPDAPFPSMRPWRETPTDQLAALDKELLATINEALAAHDAAPLPALADMLSCHEEFLCTLPELDHYGAREDARYRGPVFTKIFGRGPDWPGREGKRVFAFLHAALPRFDDVFRHLRALGAPCFAYVRGADDAQCRAIECETIRVTNEPIDLISVMESSDALICNGGHATIAAAMLAGNPIMIVPHYVEQCLMAHRLGQGAMALAVDNKMHDEYLGQLIARLCDDTELAAKAERIAGRYAGHDMDAEVAEIASRLEVLALDGVG